jgi:hypothetical protein
MNEELDKFIMLFRGRADVYGHEEGRCVKEPLTPAVFESHLLGVNAIGVYPIVPTPEGTFIVAWGCSDIDIDDFGMAASIYDALEAGGAHPYLERSRSKGYHIWVFATSPVFAPDMRSMFLAAHQVAEVPAREVNPKQVALRHGQYGNYVRLPYFSGYNCTPARRVIIDRHTQQPIPMDSFLQNVVTTDVDIITRLAAYYKPPVRTYDVRTDDQQCEGMDEALKFMSPLAKVIWRDGPLPNRDRSTTLTRLAYVCAEDGLNPSQVKVVITDADRRWGKYHLRADGELEIDKLVSRVFT